MLVKNTFVPGVFVPYKLIFKNELYNIIDLEKKFIIRGYTIQTVDKQIDMVFIKNPHPNANPKTGEFCIPNSLREHTICTSSKNILELILCCFNLDDCYFTPWDEIKYKRQEV